jgi:hypothetical protein
VAKWHIRIYDCLEKEEYENQKVKRKTNRSSSATPTKQNKIKARYKTKPKKKLDKNTSNHNKSQTQNKSFDSGRTVERGFRRASSSYHSSLILLYIVIPFKLAESRRV